MERMEALEAAMEIVNTARYATSTTNEGAYEFLRHVTEYIKWQSKIAFAAAFKEA